MDIKIDIACLCILLLSLSASEKESLDYIYVITNNSCLIVRLRGEKTKTEAWMTD